MSERRPFIDRLAQAVDRCGTRLLVGLDPRLDQLPSSLAVSELADWSTKAAAYDEFCREIIDVVGPLVPAVKPQAAFFEELGPSGMTALRNVIQHARRSGLLVILDGKRGDIGSTATAYAKGYLDSARGDDSAWDADALTVNPYLGDDSLEPFVEQAQNGDSGVFVLVKTSNAGGGMFQDLMSEGKPIYRHVAELVEKLAQRTKGECGYGAVGAVVGATYPEQLTELRAAMPHAWLLVPGFGAQGGTAQDVAAAFDASGHGAVVNSSRGIIFAHRRPEYSDSNWQQAVESATMETIQQLRDVARTSP